MTKRWFTAGHWLSSQAKQMEVEGLERFLLRIADRIDSKEIKAIFQEEMIKDGYFDDVRSKVWEKTADMQWVFRVTDTQINVLDVLKREEPLEHPGYWIRYTEVDLSDYSNEQITMEIALHGYSSMNAVRSIFGPNSIFIYAECIASNEEFDPFTFMKHENLESVADALYGEWGIQTDWTSSIAG